MWTEAGWDDVESEPAWLGIGWITGEAWAGSSSCFVILAGMGARRLRRSEGTTSTLVRVATVLDGDRPDRLRVAVWAM